MSEIEVYRKECHKVARDFNRKDLYDAIDKAKTIGELCRVMRKIREEL